MSMPALLHDLLDAAAAEHPRAPAVRCGSQVVDYATAAAWSRRLAGWLSGAGVGRGDRVVIALPLHATLPALLFACSRVGAVFVLVGERTPAAVAEHLLDDCRPALVLAADDVLTGLAEQHGIDHRGPDDLVAALAGVGLPDGEGSAPAGTAVDPACLVYTSGSTALPKAVVCTHQQMTFATEAIASRLRYRPDDIVYCALPLTFDYGLYQIFLCTRAAAQLFLTGRQGAGHRMLVDLRDSGATILPAVPTLAANLDRLLSRQPVRLPRLRLLTNTGAAMPEGLLARLRARLPSLRVQLMYGLTECKRVAIMPPDEDLRVPGSCGRPLPGTEVFVVDDEGARLPAGQVGQIVVRGPHVMSGYWRRPESTVRQFPRVDGLFPQLLTGDYGWLDDDGYLYFAGRRDDVYKERGTRVSAVEVEAAASRVAGVRAAAVLPPGPGEDGATLLAEAAISGAELLRLMTEQIDEMKVPTRCVVVDELPLTAHGKVARPRLREFAATADQTGGGGD